MKNNRNINQKKLNHLKNIRENLFENINKNKKTNLRKLSKLLGRNDAYLQQYIKRGSPNYLPEEERLQLCNFLKIDFKDLTPKWLHIDQKVGKDFYQINNNNKNHIHIPKKLFDDLKFSNANNLYLNEFTLNYNSKNTTMIRAIIDKGINHFQDHNDYVLDDNNNLFLANLSIDLNASKKDHLKLIVKPFEQRFTTFRITEEKLKIYAKIIFKSNNYFY